MSDCKTDGRPMLPEPEWQVAWQIGYRWTRPQTLTHKG